MKSKIFKDIFNAVMIDAAVVTMIRKSEGQRHRERKQAYKAKLKAMHDDKVYKASYPID